MSRNQHSRCSQHFFFSSLGAWVSCRCWRHHRLGPYNNALFAWVGCCERRGGGIGVPDPRMVGAADAPIAAGPCLDIQYYINCMDYLFILYVAVCMNICIRRKGLFREARCCAPHTYSYVRLKFNGTVVLPSWWDHNNDMHKLSKFSVKKYRDLETVTTSKCVEEFKTISYCTFWWLFTSIMTEINAALVCRSNAWKMGK